VKLPETLTRQLIRHAADELLRVVLLVHDRDTAAAYARDAIDAAASRAGVPD
jgi:hypothetical protein